MLAYEKERNLACPSRFSTASDPAFLHSGVKHNWPPT